MADDEKNNVFKRLKKLFSTNTIVRNVGGKKLRVADTDNIQSFVNRRGIDRYNRVYNSQTGGYGSHHGRHEAAAAFQGARLQLFRDYDQMDNDPIISSVLDIYADESTVKDEFSRVLTIKTSNTQLQQVLDNLFYDILNIEFNLWPWIRNLVKYGDFFLYLDIDKEYGITNVIPLSVYETTRVEGEDPENPFTVRFTIQNDFLNLGKKEFDNYEVAHFRMLSDTNFLPYGKAIIEGGRRTWKQLQLMEDAMLIHRIMRAPDKRKFKIDIGNIPPAEIDTYMNRIIEKMKKIPLVDPKTGDYNLRYNMMNIVEDFYLPVRGRESGTDIETMQGLQFNAIEDIEYLRNKLMAAFKVPKAFLGYEEDLCIAPYTKIPLVSGEEKTVDELISDYDNGIKNYVYSIDEQTQKIVAGEIEWAGYTRKNATVVRVHLDNGSYIDCTPDHLFMTRDGDWVEAQSLQTNQSLMPLYTRPSTHKKISGYTEVYHPGENSWEMMHRVVSKQYNIKTAPNNVIHHIDLNKWNNTPENLDGSMTWYEHRALHSKLLSEGRSSLAMLLYRKTPQFIENCKKNGRKGGLIAGKKLGRWVMQHGPSNKGQRAKPYRKCKACDALVYNKLYCNHVCWGKYHQGNTYNCKFNSITFELLVECAKTSSSFKEIERMLGITRRTLNRVFDKYNINPTEFVWKYMPTAQSNTGFMNNFTQSKLNHKVVSVESLSETIDTCDLRITKYHNFATTAGVIIHNSGKASLAAQDVRFARTIERVQRIMISELTKLAVIHLYVQGYTDEELVNFELSLTNPSTLYEQEKINLWQQRFNLASQMTGGQSILLSQDWVYKHILELSEEEVEDERKKIAEDNKRTQEQQAAAQGGMPGMGGEGAASATDDTAQSDDEVAADDTVSSDDEAQLDDVDEILASLESDDGDDDAEELDEFFVKRKGGRPKEGLKFGTDKHPLGRDPLGHREIWADKQYTTRKLSMETKNLLGQLPKKRPSQYRQLISEQLDEEIEKFGD